MVRERTNNFIIRRFALPLGEDVHGAGRLGAVQNGTVGLMCSDADEARVIPLEVHKDAVGIHSVLLLDVILHDLLFLLVGEFFVLLRLLGGSLPLLLGSHVGWS